MRSFLERHLAQDGFEVVGAEDGEALELIERVCPDLVLIGDPEVLPLPDRSGIRFILRTDIVSGTVPQFRPTRFFAGKGSTWTTAGKRQD